MRLVGVASPLAHLVVDERGDATVAHGETDLERGLDPLEDVVLLDGDGEYRAARVVAVDFTLDDTIYLLQIGLRLPPEVARACLERERHGAFLDLFGDLRWRRD